MKKAIVLYGSSREHGNTEYLADYALSHAAQLDVTKIFLRDCSIQPLTDERHSGRPFPAVPDDYKRILCQMMEADVVIFATPVYWYNMSNRTKLFVDRWTESLRDPEIDLKKAMRDKAMYLICTGANPNPEVIQPMIGIFRLMATYFGMQFKGCLWANADRPGDVKQAAAALEQAKAFLAEAGGAAIET